MDEEEHLEEELLFSVGGGQSSTAASKMIVSSSSHSKRTKRSSVWNYFKIEKDDQGEERARCNTCQKSYLWLKNTGTSNLLRHCEKCSTDGGRKLAMFDDKIAREKFSRVIIRHNLPFLAVEYEELRDYLSYLNPGYKCYTRNTAAADVVKTWEKEKQKLKCELDKISSRVCLTSDCWSTTFGDGYIVLTAHYVDTKWTLNCKILSFCDMPPPHTGDALASKIHEFLKEWGIEKRVFSLTLDNATANNSLQETLKDRLNLDDNLLCRGEFFHVRCCAHILNLIVQDGLDVIADALSKIRDTVKYFKGSKSRRIALGECIEGDSEVILILDVPHRWNSTYSMLEKALKYERALNRFKVVDKNYKYCPSNQEWKRAKIICELLMPFYSITTLMSGRCYSTSNLYFGHIWKITFMSDFVNFKMELWILIYVICIESFNYTTD